MAVNGKSRRAYKGAPVSNALGSSTLSTSDTSINLASAVSGWPTGTDPFFIVIDPGTTKEEKICVVYNTTTNLVVVNPAATSGWTANVLGRGCDDTTAKSHDPGAVIYPVFTALEANQSNELVSKYANAGSVVYQGSGTPGTFTELAIGTAGLALTVNAGATAPQWGQVGTAGIADSSITTAKIADGAIVLADLAASLQAYLVPVGSINAYAGTTAPTGWLMCDGTSTTGYAALAALVGATTPDMRGLFPMGKTASSTGSTLLGTGGSTTITTSNMPSHTHTQDAHNHTQNSHNHTQDAHNHTQDSHNHTQNAHSHTIDNHTHTNQVTYISPAASHAHNNISDYVAAGTNGAPTSPTVASISTTSLSANSNTATNNANTATNQATTATNQAATATNVATTATNQNTGGGTAYFQPFIAVNYIIKY
jgi:microcystin-dependent protein